MLIRRAKRTDIPQISRLYYEIVHRVNPLDCTPEQIHAWAPRVYPDTFWHRRFRRYSVFVAEDDGVIVSFAELARTGAIDCFYVHHTYQHRGVGAALMARIEWEARSRGNTRLHADVSITAEPFFRRMGFKQGVMEKRLMRNVVKRALARPGRH